MPTGDAGAFGKRRKPAVGGDEHLVPVSCQFHIEAIIDRVIPGYGEGKRLAHHSGSRYLHDRRRKVIKRGDGEFLREAVGTHIFPEGVRCLGKDQVGRLQPGSGHEIAGLTAPRQLDIPGDRHAGIDDHRERP